MSDFRRRLDAIRRDRSEVENHLIDEYAAGRLDRREFIRRGTILGVSLPTLSFIAAACGGSDSSSSSSAAPASETGSTTDSGAASSTETAAPASGGTIRVAITAPAAAVDPVTIADAGGLCVLAQTGEFLCVDKDGEFVPWLAESWEPNADSTEWTFKIRQGVTFNDGTPMTANDVVASIDRLADPDNKSNALSAFSGVLSKGATSAPDDSTVVFKLDAPNGSFPFYVSSDNYNAVILPASYAGDFETSWPGTGPWKNESFTAKQGATFVRNDGYWGDKAIPDRLELIFAEDEQAKVGILQSGGADMADTLSVTGGAAIFGDSANWDTIAHSAATHRQLSMRVDKAPFQDKRARQALALTLNRADIIQGLFDGQADLGNDSPFAPLYPTTDTSIPQREQDLAKAKELWAASGAKAAGPVPLATWKNAEMPDYAQVIKQAAGELGIDVKINVYDADTYYSKYWLEEVMSLCDYGHRGVPNVYLAAPLTSKGTWNAAHFANAEYDKLVADYVGQSDIGQQKAIAGKIQTLLLDETPVIFAYFFKYLSPVKKGITGAETTAMGHVFVHRAVLPAA